MRRSRRRGSSRSAREPRRAPGRSWRPGPGSCPTARAASPCGCPRWRPCRSRTARKRRAGSLAVVWTWCGRDPSGSSILRRRPSRRRRSRSPVERRTPRRRTACLSRRRGPRVARPGSWQRSARRRPWPHRSPGSRGPRFATRPCRRARRVDRPPGAGERRGQADAHDPDEAREEGRMTRPCVRMVVPPGVAPAVAFFVEPPPGRSRGYDSRRRNSKDMFHPRSIT